ANLILSRGMSRRHACAVRRAMGASTAVLVREEMADATIIAIVGGGLGFLIAGFLVRGSAWWLRDPITLLTTSNALLDLEVQPAVLGFAAIITLAAVIVAGVIPAIHVSRASIRGVLPSDGNTSPIRWRG